MSIINQTRQPIYRDDQEVDPLYNPIYGATRALVGFTQGLFKHLPSGRYRWSSDPNQTEIMISDLMPITSEMLSFRPAVLTMTGQVSFGNTAQASLQDVNPKTGHKVYRDVLSSTVTFNCISRNGIEASRIAWFIAHHVKSLRVFLQRNGPFLRIGHDVMILGEQPAGLIVQDAADGGAINVPVAVPFALAHKWEVREPSYEHDTTHVNLTTIGVGDSRATNSYQITNEVN